MCCYFAVSSLILLMKTLFVVMVDVVVMRWCGSDWWGMVVMDWYGVEWWVGVW